MTLIKTPKILSAPFYFLRHGQTDWNRENRCMGQTDIPLNDRGIAQALSARNSLIQAAITAIYHSPLSRAKMTAEILNVTLKCPLIPVEELMEFNLGPFSGKIIENWFDEWRAGKAFNGTELYSDFIERALIGVNKALKSQGPILIVAHGGIYWAIEHAIQNRLNPDLPNCVPAFHTPPKNLGEPWTVSLLK